MLLDRFKLDGQVAIITGSRRGLGQAMAVGLAEAGADIVSFDRNEPAETRTQIEALDRQHSWVQVDLLSATPPDLERLIGEVFDQWGRLDILVNNAGVCPREALLDYPAEYWQQAMQVNLNAPWFLAQAAARRMVEQGRGKIINIASLLAYQGGVNIPAYTASKHGVAGFTKAMANQLAARGVNVNSITPGYMRTDLTEPLIGTPRGDEISGRIPAGRWGQPVDLQGACLLLASAAGDYLHGVDIIVDGGWLSR